MITNKTTIRIRYGETDQMGIVNNANYPSFFEIGRTELFRDLGISYAQMERDGILLPVSELFVKYFKSAFYDDLVEIETELKEFPTSRIRFEYTLRNQNGETITAGYTVLGFLNAETKRPMRIPPLIAIKLEPFF